MDEQYWKTMFDFQNVQLLDDFFRLINEMNDPNNWADQNHYSALRLAFQDAREEILRRMQSG
jgi:hypothetical protein